jgi:hypothetical protein
LKYGDYLDDIEMCTFHPVRHGFLTTSKDFGLNLAKAQPVSVQFHLSESAHAERYALKALPSDPASRLVVSISGQGKTLRRQTVQGHTCV